jgi:hypothetical protein
MATFHIELEQNELQQVLNVLGQRPFAEVAPLINKIAQQAQAPPPPGNGQHQEKAPAPNG